jgi:hypothetical protein
VRNCTILSCHIRHERCQTKHSVCWDILFFLATYLENSTSHMHAAGNRRNLSTANLYTTGYSWRKLHQNSVSGTCSNLFFNQISEEVSNRLSQSWDVILSGMTLTKNGFLTHEGLSSWGGVYFKNKCCKSFKCCVTSLKNTSSTKKSLKVGKHSTFFAFYAVSIKLQFALECTNFVPCCKNGHFFPCRQI